MNAINPEQRGLLERTIVAARGEAEKAAHAALQTLAVNTEPFASMTDEQRALRIRLRAEVRRLGGIESLESEVAYGQWHRMLFARFLAENGLLMHPMGAAVTLDECAELASEEGEPDGWMLAARYGAASLPGVFRADDPALQVRFAAEGRQALENLLGTLPSEVFLADDALGWVYQFWQTQAKKDVNASGRKVGGADISPVTQLFTERYMVQFLLHNSLGAWWAARHPGEALPTELDYLRRLEDGTPAAGSFPGWPATAKELRILDPSCGSGHFLVAAFLLMIHLRMAEEGLSERDAGDAVLRDNLFGLELDPRCTQIAAFALALTAWKHGGYRPLPLPNIACSGIRLGGTADDWRKLAGRDGIMQAVLAQVRELFAQAPDLGSLLDPNTIGQTVTPRPRAAALPSGASGSVLQMGLLPTTAPTLWEGAEGGGADDDNWAGAGQLSPLVAMERLLPKLAEAAERFGEGGDDTPIFGEAAKQAVRAVGLLAGKYHLVITNVPYLGRGNQGETLRNFCATNYPDAKADLATAFLRRCLQFCAPGGSTALVTPQNWLFLGSYANLRGYLLRQKTWDVVARLGSGAFETIGGEVVNVGLFVLTNAGARSEQMFAGLDVSAPRTPREKDEFLRTTAVLTVAQAGQLNNPDSRIALDSSTSQTLLEAYASGMVGVQTADYAMFGRCFWELPIITPEWALQQSTVDVNCNYSGREHMILWENFEGELARRNSAGQAYVRGRSAWGKSGVAVGSMGTLPVTLYTGELFDNNAAVVLPKDPAHLPAIWCFCSSPEFHTAVRRIDQKLNVTNATLVKVPFDLAHWQKVAEEKYPDGLPEPHSDDPTQWLFDGRPASAKGAPGDPLQVAVARLLGYKWPRQMGAKIPGCDPLPDDNLDVLSDSDGIVCLPPIAGEQPAAERLRALLASAYGVEWSPAILERLLSDAGYGGKGFDEWLRDGFFAQHAKRFHNRPFIWHVWDGRKDGFAALVNYHRLDRATLDRLIYTYLGTWITTQRHAEETGEPGANGRLVAALDLQKKLQAIADGEPPHDIYVRWKPDAEQPIGWAPDLNDGVRMNVRPFVNAGVLRAKFTINWNKDRGTNPDGSERINDRHLIRAEKESARLAAGKP